MSLFRWRRRKSESPQRSEAEVLPSEAPFVVTAGPDAVAAGGSIIGSALGANSRVINVSVAAAVSEQVARSAYERVFDTLPPSSASEARELWGSWPGMQNVLDLLPGDRASRRSVLLQWGEHEPSWLVGAPARALVWLAHLASTYDASAASHMFYDRALHQGGYPRDYLAVRAALQAEKGTSTATAYLAAHEDLDSPLVRALRALLAGDRPTALEQLSDWTPVGDDARMLKLLLETDAHVGQGLIDEALPALREAEDARFPQIGLALTQALLQRAVRRGTRNKLADANEALAVALRSRNARRAWYGDSAAAVVLAVQAALFSQDLSTAWSLSQPAPEGTATVHEAEDPRVLEQSALVAAMTGRERQARDLLTLVTNPFAKAQVLAVVAELHAGGDSEDGTVAAAWMHAWDAAQPGPEQLMAATGLVEAGRDLPDLSHLKGDYPEAVADLEMFARAVGGSAGGDISVLRASASRNPMIAVKLAQRYRSSGDVQKAASALKEAGEQWRDARLMAMAARSFKQTRAMEQAKECAEGALRIGGSKWAAQGAMYALLVEVESATGHWDRATDAAITLLGLDPNDADARWALVKCYTTRARPMEAWQTLTELGEPVAPRHREEAILWVQLGASHSSDPQFVGRALELMRRWPDDEELLGRFLGALHWRAAGAQPMTDEAGEQLRAASSEYLERFPQSALFRAIDVSNPEAALQELGENLRREHEGNKEIRERVSLGDFPLGMLSLASGKSYAEVCVRQTSGRPGVLATDPVASGTEAEAVRTATAGRVALDTSAAVSLALLEAGVADRLLGCFQSTVTTDQIVADTFNAVDSLTLRSDLTLVWDETESRAVFRTIPDELLSVWRGTLERASEIVQSLRRVARPELRVLPRLDAAHATQPWLTALDYAKEYGLVLWCDDRALRSVARSVGVEVFGTLSLIEARETEGTMTRQEAVAVKAALLRNFYMDIPFSSDLYGFAAQADGWRAQGVAAALARPAVWTEPRDVVALVMNAVAQIVDSQPEEASAWLAAAYAGLWRATPPSHRPTNLRTLTFQTLAQPWVSASTLPFVLAGLRSGAAEVADNDEPLQAALARYYEELVKILRHPAAGTAFMNLFAQANETDKAAAARTVITQRDD